MKKTHRFIITTEDFNVTTNAVKGALISYYKIRGFSPKIIIKKIDISKTTEDAKHWQELIKAISKSIVGK
jgi:hypothetical protein